MIPSKEQNNCPITDSKEMEIYKLPDNFLFLFLIVKNLNKRWKNTDRSLNKSGKWYIKKKWDIQHAANILVHSSYFHRFVCVCLYCFLGEMSVGISYSIILLTVSNSFQKEILPWNQKQAKILPHNVKSTDQYLLWI